MQTTLPKLLCAVSMLLLTACQAGVSLYTAYPTKAPPVNSKLILNSPLDFSRGQLNVIIQDGKIQDSSWALDQYRAHCDFELYTKPKNATRIKPDTFTVTRVVLDTEHVMLAPVNVADIGFSGGPPHEEFQTFMYLHSARQPNVFRITCKHWVDPAIDAEHLSIADIRQALGKLFTLKIAK